MYWDTEHLKMFDVINEAERAVEHMQLMLKYVLSDVDSELLRFFNGGIGSHCLDLSCSKGNEESIEKGCVEMLNRIDCVFDRAIVSLNECRNFCNEVVYKYFNNLRSKG